ncbi:transcriptional regulator [Nocardia farcinica]|jgi:transcriptional regulator with XRE-family HTH domain|uniref:helix-turn-helix transcriptional regulator n=1 Tax=Nocardia TaxID=1817 RepID=UPI00031566E5|nr:MULTISPECIES: helix-turn-helix transcriptional regulator [Nocardia]MBF6588464.1 transcriptional regulator [Nocardia farcinica]
MSRTFLAGFDPAALKLIRERKGLTVGDLARMSGMGISTLHHWESGRRLPSVPALRRVAAELGVDLSELIVVPPDERMLSYYRNVNGYTQPELAAEVGMKTSTLSAVERAEIPLSDEVADRLSRVLGVAPELLRAGWNRARTRPPGTRA